VKRAAEWIVVVAVGLGACGPGLKRPEPAVSFVDASGDATRIQKLMVMSITNGGLGVARTDAAQQ